MDFRHLRAFITVAEEASVTKAAERLHISQPPLSRHIKQLEDELGITLFIRHRQGVTLTEAGQHLLEKARALAAAASDFYESANQTTRHDANKVRLGIGWGLWDTVNRIRVASATQFGHLTIEATDVTCAEQYNHQLQDGSLDVVFGRPHFDPEIAEAVPLYQERMLAVLSSDSPLASQQDAERPRPRVRAAAPLRPAHLAVPLRQSPRPVLEGGRDAAHDSHARGGPVQPGRPDAGRVGQGRLRVHGHSADQPARR